MGRIEKAYRTRFHWLLETVHARQLEKGVQLLVDKAQRLSATQHISPADALLQVQEELASKHPFRQLINPARRSEEILLRRGSGRPGALAASGRL